MELQKVKDFIKPYFVYTENFSDYIISQNPSSENIIAISNLKQLKDKVFAANNKFLTHDKLEECENIIFPFLIYWNRKISTQVDSYQKTLSAIAGRSIKKSRGEFFDPLSLFHKERKRYLMAEDFVLSIIKSVDKQKIDEVKLAAVFYAFIVLHDAVEYYFRNPLTEGLEKYSLSVTYPIQNIFYVDQIRKDVDEKDYADTKLIRNALSHFNYSIDIIKGKNIITFLPDSKYAFHYDLKEFLEFLSQYRFLIQTMWALLSIKICFTQIRRFFTKDKD